MLSILTTCGTNFKKLKPKGRKVYGKRKNEMSLRIYLQNARASKLLFVMMLKMHAMQNGKVIENIDGEIKETKLNENNFQDK